MSIARFGCLGDVLQRPNWRCGEPKALQPERGSAGLCLSARDAIEAGVTTINH